jgi:CotH kinase protein/Lamin Tail Domain/Secretion system C-terminal sorting domain
MKIKIIFCSLLLFHFLGNAQILTHSNLPIVVIDTDIDPVTGLPTVIPDDPKVLGTMKIIYHPDGSRNFLTDTSNPAFLNYSGRLGIEIRGTTSALLDKKPYSLTTLRSDNVSNNNVSILGMPAENDWVLNSLAFDETLIRDYLTYDIARNTGNYASRGRYCEVVVNGDYKGLYIFMEKLKANSERINILRVGSADNSLPSVSGGYITKCDKTTGGDPIAWSFPTNDINKNADFIHESPKPTSVTAQQNTYIYNQFLALETEAQNNNASIVNGFPSVIDIPSFVDFMLVNELTSNVDSYQYSTFFHKDRNSKLRAGPVWDFNVAWGYDPAGRSGFDIWQFSNTDNLGAKFWKNLFDNPVFHCYLVKRWNELTATGGPFDYNAIEHVADSLDNLLTEAAQRENARWFTIFDHNARFGELKTWLQARINWMNNNIGTTTGCSFPVLPNLVISKIHYNPVAAGGYTGNDLEFIEITNNSSSSIDVSGYYLRELGVSYIFPNGSMILPNKKIYLVSNTTAFLSFYGINAFDVFTRNLSNKSQKLSLADPYGNIIDYVDYNDSAPWPTAADGTGPYLNLINLNSDNALAVSWTTSVQPLAGVTLPVTFLSFGGRIRNSMIELQWQTENETDNLLFDIERSNDSRNFYKIGEVPGMGNSNTAGTYHFNDLQPLFEANYYRLKQVDISGRLTYSNVILMRHSNEQELAIYPNPVTTKLLVTGVNGTNNVYAIKNSVGQIVMSGFLSENNTIDVTKLKSGLYYITTGNAVLKFVKQPGN